MQDAQDKLNLRVFNARRDTIDFNDRLYQPPLILVPRQVKPKAVLPALDQGKSTACTGFALATVIQFLLRERQDTPEENVSAEMLYDLAKRYDEWAGIGYDGSSARGAMKAWHKHGVCLKNTWGGRLTFAIAKESATRPLGAYYRVNHKDLVSIHTAINEVGILYATSAIHTGWLNVSQTDPRVKQDSKSAMLGGHAFVITGYDQDGLYIQNSWGEEWGNNGIAHLSYDDWLENSMDLWVARLGVPVNIKRDKTVALSRTIQARQSEASSVEELNPHVISIADNGLLLERGPYSTHPSDFAELFSTYLPEKTADWPFIKLMIYGHGGLVGEGTAIQRLSEFMGPCLERNVFPIVVSWNSDGWTTITNILKESFAPRSKDGIFVDALDYMLDRLDDTLEPLARPLGKRMWDEMKNNALLATMRTAEMFCSDGKQEEGGLRIFLAQLFSYLQNAGKPVQVHLVGHSAGSILLAPVVEMFNYWKAVCQAEQKTFTPITSCTLWAPACTTDLFERYYRPALNEKTLQSLNLFTLSDQVEQDDNCAKLYNKSLLYLVSNSFEERPRVEGATGTPILGMSKFIKNNPSFSDILRKGENWIISPNDAAVGTQGASRASGHGAFDNDKATLLATLARIVEAQDTQSDMEFNCSPKSVQTARKAMQQISQTI